MRYLPPTNDSLAQFGNRMPVLLDCLLDIFQTERHGTVSPCSSSAEGVGNDS